MCCFTEPTDDSNLGSDGEQENDDDYLDELLDEVTKIQEVSVIDSRYSLCLAQQMSAYKNCWMPGLSSY